MWYKKGYVVGVLLLLAISATLTGSLRAETQNLVSQAQKLADAGVIDNQKDSPSLYRVGSNISRREMLKIMMKLSGKPVGTTCATPFSDLPPSDWACKYVTSALAYGYLAKNDRFRGDDALTKIEALKMIFKAKSISVPATSDWRIGYVQKAVSLGYAQDFRDYDAKATRGFVFDIGAKTLTKTNPLIQKVSCASVLTPAKNSKTGECIVFPNSCIPTGYQAVSSCGPQVAGKREVLSVEFAVNMNQKSVESNLKLSPQYDYTTKWQDPRHLEIVLEEEINQEMEILVNILDEALDQSGQKLQQPFFKTFKVSGETVVDFVAPEGKLTDVMQNITVRFSKPMISLTNLDSQPSCPFEITPVIQGKCVWITTSTVQFRPLAGFPYGAKYTIVIPSGLPSLVGDKLLHSKAFEVETPAFALLSAPEMLNKDDEMVFVFNDEVDLDAFKKVFTLTGKDPSTLRIEYYTSETGVEGVKKTHTNALSVFPISGDWGYSTKYNYTLNAGLTSSRGNIGTPMPSQGSVSIRPFLLSSKPFVYLKEDAQNKNLPSNFQLAQNPSIIVPKDPRILLEFYEEVALDPSLVSLQVPFSLEYALKYDENSKTNRVIPDHKQVILSIQGAVPASLRLGVRASNQDTSYQYVDFQTKQANDLLSYTNINYKKACMVSKNPLRNYGVEKKAFVFDHYGVISWVSEVSQYTKDKDCAYQAGKYSYVISQQLNPSTKYHLNIKKEFLDADNYPLQADESYDFTTDAPQNEDKHVSILNASELTLVPKYITPLSVAISSVNVGQIQVKACQGTFEPTAPNQMEDPQCQTKTLSVNNLGFQPNITVVDLTQILGSDLTSQTVFVQVTKKDADLSSSEKKYPSISQASFVRSNVAGVMKYGKNPTLWLHNYESGENLSDAISSFVCYESKYNYSTFGRYTGMTYTNKGKVNFTSQGTGLYTLSNISNCALMVANLTSGEKVYFTDAYSSQGGDNTIAYLSSDKPLYQPGETVRLKGIVRKLTPEGLDLPSSQIHVRLMDAQYQQILEKSLTLSENSTFELTYEIPKDAKLGSYEVTCDGGRLSFGVEKYEKPEFEVTARPVSEHVTAPASAKVELSAKYYMGMMMTSGQGSYSIKKTPYYFDGGKTKGYYWGETEPYRYDFYWGSPRETASIWKEGDLYLGNDGHALVSFDIDQDENALYQVSSTITDPNTKKSVSSNTQVLGLSSDTFLGLKFDKYYYQYQDTAHIGVASVDVKGDKKANTPFTFDVYRIEHLYDETTYQSGDKETKLLTKDLTTDAQGLASVDYTFAGYGEYRIEINTKDGKSLTSRTLYISGGGLLRPNEGDHTLRIIAPEDQVSVGDKTEMVVQSPVAGVKAMITIEKLNKVLSASLVDLPDYNSRFTIPIDQRYLPNFTVKVYVIQDLKVANNALEKLKALRVEMLEVEKALQKPGNFFQPIIICDTSIKGFYHGDEKWDEALLKKLSEMRKQEQSLLSDLLPNYYEGTREFEVSTKPVEITTTIHLDKESYLPGDQQTIHLTLSDASGTPINGEMTFKIVDDALLALQNNQTSLLETLYQSRPSSVGGRSNLENLIKRIEFQPKPNELAEDESKGGSSSGRGDVNYAREEMAMDAEMSPSMAPMAMKSEALQGNAVSDKADNADKVRSEFSDLAYYKGTVKITNGEATITVPKLPDNLTTWHISGFVITPDSKVGDLEKKFLVTKTLSLAPQVPSFVVSGDVFEIGGLVHNTSKITQDVIVSIDAPGFDLTATPQTFKVPANESKLVTWMAHTKKISNTETERVIPSKVTLKVATDGLSDTVVVPTKTVKDTTSEYVFTNGSTYDLSYEEKLHLPTYLDAQGYLEVSMGASLLTNLLQNLDAYVFFPSDDLWSKLSFLEIEMALKDLFQKTGKSDEFAKIQVKDVYGISYSLASVEKLVLDDLKNYLESDGGLGYFQDCELWGYRDSCSNRELTGKYLSLKLQAPGIDSNTLLEYYQKSLLEDKMNSNIDLSPSAFLPLSFYGKTAFINQNLTAPKQPSNQEKLDYLRVYQNLKTQGALSNQYYQDLKNSLLVEARGTFLPESRFAYSNSQSTALMLSLLIDHSEAEPLLKENIARWLLSHRDDSGRYYLDDVPEILRALTAYIDSTDETKGVNFEAKAYLNQQVVQTTHFDQSNLFVPVHKLFDFSQYVKFGVDNSLGFEKTGSGKLYYDIGVRYYLPVSKIEPRDEGIIVERNYYDFQAYQQAFQTDCIEPWWSYGRKSIQGFCTKKKVKNIDQIAKTKKGSFIVGEIKIIVDRERSHVQVKDFLPAGASILNTNFKTTSDAVKDISGSMNDTWWRSGWTHTEQRDEMMYLYAEFLSPGEYTYTYVLKAESVGTFALRPAVAELIDTPEVWGRSKGSEFVIE